MSPLATALHALLAEHGTAAVFEVLSGATSMLATAGLGEAKEEAMMFAAATAIDNAAKAIVRIEAPACTLVGQPAYTLADAIEVYEDTRDDLADHDALIAQLTGAVQS